MTIEEAIRQRAFEDVWHKLAVNLLYTSNQFRARFEQELARHDVSQAQFNVLRILRGSHPTPMPLKAIRERMLDPMSNTSRLVEKLRSKGLVDRTPCPRDRRAVDIRITDAGLARLAELDTVVRELNRQYRTLDEDDAERLNDLLDRLRG